MSIADAVRRTRANAVSTAPADRDAAERTISELYRRCGRSRPRFAWFASPLTARAAEYALNTAGTIQEGTLSRAIERALGGSLVLGPPLYREMFEASRAKLCKRIETTLSRRLEHHGPISGSDEANEQWVRLTQGPTRDLGRLVERAVFEDMGAAVEQATGQAACLLACWVEGRSRDELLWPAAFLDAFGGQFDLPWADHYLLFEPLGLRDPDLELLRLHARLPGLCGPWWPHEEVCIVSDRPSDIHLDERGLAHNETGPAIRFRDGWSIWALEGILVDEAVVLRPDSITKERIATEGNEEVRRVLLGRYGWERYLRETNATVLDMDADADGILRALMKTGGHVVLVCACTSTGRTFAMEVEPACTTCVQAAQWLAGDDKIRIVSQS